MLNETAIISNIKQKIEEDFEQGGYKLENTHFANGRNLHSRQYYFAKRYFQSSDNCIELAKLLAGKLESLGLENNTTLIGFRNYSGLLLNYACSILNNNNYAIVEEEEGNYIWQHLPSLKKHLVIIIPIACTCSTFVRMRKFINDYLRSQHLHNDITITPTFIPLFLILSESLKKYEFKNLKVSDLREPNEEIHKIYSAFDWNEINIDHIVFNSNENTSYQAYPLIRLFSEIYLPETCKICFPVDRLNGTEKPLLQTHDNYETPTLIFKYPNFNPVENSSKLNFFDSFSTVGDTWNIHLYGHIKVNKSRYKNYIRGNAFYEKNKSSILKYFEEKLKAYIKDDDKSIILITAEDKHNSNFLDDLAYSNTFKGRSVTILRFQPSHEFVDNFISLHSDFINQKCDKVIYFEEVMSAGKTFKLISNYIKHSKQGEDKLGRHGLDLVLTLIDRTTLHTKDEILKKLHSKKMPLDPAPRFISYFSLNVPIISASHLGNPLTTRNKDLINLIHDSHLDAVKKIIMKELSMHQPKKLPELELSEKDNSLHFFPFVEKNNLSLKELVEQYSPVYNKERLDLLKLYFAHHINTELSQKKYNESGFFSTYINNPELLIEELLLTLNKKTAEEIDSFFAHSLLPNRVRNTNLENEIVNYIIIKLLARHPFTYYKDIYIPIFNYCVKHLSKLNARIEQKGIPNFMNFRELKFFIRRSVELNSNFIISDAFLKCIKVQYSKQRIELIMAGYKSELLKLDQTYNESSTRDSWFYKTIKRNIQYKQDQLSSYFLFLIFCYKELVLKNPYRSIKLEELINSKELLPPYVHEAHLHNDQLETVISNPYYQFTGMLKAENIYFLKELKELHKKRGEGNWAKHENEGLFKIRLLYNYYFRMKKNDPIILNAKKLLAKSRFNNIENRREREKKLSEIKTSVCAMLKTVSLLESRKLRKDDKLSVGTDLNSEIVEILNAVLEIIQPGISKDNLDYAFCIEYRKDALMSRANENIYTILSKKKPDSTPEVKLDKNGLVVNLLNGLTDINDFDSEESLLTVICSKDGKVRSFKEKYATCSNQAGVTIEELYKKDLYNPETKMGLQIINDSSMSLYFRLSTLNKTKSNELVAKLEGQAVLVITCKLEPNLVNYLEFMSNEKIRLILLIKTELLEYLQKQFENDAFIEILENRKRESYQRKLEHGLSRYRIAQNKLFEESSNSTDEEIIDRNRIVNKIINDAIDGQFYFRNKPTITETPVEYKTSKILTKIKYILESPCFFGCVITESEIKYSGFTTDLIVMYPSIFNVVIPELIINMKKCSSRQRNDGLTIEYSAEQNKITFRNDIRKAFLNDSDDKDFGGLNMCREIIAKLKLQPLEIPKRTDEYFTVSINLNKQPANG